MRRAHHEWRSFFLETARFLECWNKIWVKMDGFFLFHVSLIHLHSWWFEEGDFGWFFGLRGLKSLSPKGGIFHSIKKDPNLILHDTSVNRKNPQRAASNLVFVYYLCFWKTDPPGIQGISKIQWIQSLQFFFRLADASTGTTTGGMGGSARRVEGFTDSPVRRYSRFLSFFWFFMMFIMMHLCRIHVVWRVTSARRSPHRRSASAVTVVTGRQPKNRAARGSTGSHGKAQNMAPGDKRSEGLQSSFTS